MHTDFTFVFLAEFEQNFLNAPEFVLWAVLAILALSLDIAVIENTPCFKVYALIPRASEREFSEFHVSTVAIL